jgi:hypothetical protein
MGDKNRAEGQQEADSLKQNKLFATRQEGHKKPQPTAQGALCY